MDAAELRAIREDRELILDYLNSVYPLALPARELLDGLLDLPRPIESHKARRDLEYLAARGLIERRREAHPVTTRPVERWRLTADGLTFCERSKPWGTIEDLSD